MKNIPLWVLLLSAHVAAYPQSTQETSLSDRERMLLRRIDQLEARVAALEGRVKQNTADAPAAPASTEGQTSLPQPAPAIPTNVAKSPFSFSDGTTLNFYFDGSYGYNFNHPVGRINLLRPNDTLANNFGVNQAGIIIDRTPDLTVDRRFGYRLDLIFGQNMEAQQGSVLNEPRPQVYRNIYQAYGSYILPLGNGLRVDFGKFANPFGVEGNFAKDQLNYSRSLLWNLLPFYHSGMRASYPFNDKLTLQYWLVNGVNQTEDFNNFKSQAVLLSFTPKKSFTWNVNYYEGQEERDIVPISEEIPPVLPTEPGLSTDKVSGRYDGRLHIMDTNATLQLGSRWTAAVAGDLLIHRPASNAPPTEVYGVAGYLHRQMTQKLGLNGRFEFVNDPGGLYTGKAQSMKEATLTAVYQPAHGFQARLEYRRDFTNTPFFLTGNPNVLKPSQNTATLGLLWWFGGKSEAW